MIQNNLNFTPFDLPTEATLLIFEKLKPRDLFALSHVSRNFRDIILNKENLPNYNPLNILLKKIIIQKHNKKNILLNNFIKETITYSLQHYSGKREAFSLKPYENEEWSGINASTLEEMSKKFSDLRVLKLNSNLHNNYTKISEKTLNLIFDKHVNIEKLGLGGLDQISENKMIDYLLKLKKLTEVTIYAPFKITKNLITALNKIPGLKKITLSGSSPPHCPNPVKLEDLQALRDSHPAANINTIGFKIDG